MLSDFSLLEKEITNKEEGSIRIEPCDIGLELKTLVQPDFLYM